MVYRITCHTWNFNFFELLAKRVGKYVCCDVDKLNSINMDIARILVRTSTTTEMDETFNVKIDSTFFRIKI